MTDIPSIIVLPKTLLSESHFVVLLGARHRGSQIESDLDDAHPDPVDLPEEGHVTEECQYGGRRCCPPSVHCIAASSPIETGRVLGRSRLIFPSSILDRPHDL